MEKIPYKITYYETVRGDQPVALFIDELYKKTQAKIHRYIDDLLAVNGPNLIRPYADIVRGKIRELRVRFSTNTVRILYFFLLNHEIILLHGFLKKTDDIPSAEIEAAERRMSDWINRHSR